MEKHGFFICNFQFIVKIWENPINYEEGDKTTNHKQTREILTGQNSECFLSLLYINTYNTYIYLPMYIQYIIYSCVSYILKA